MGGAAALLTGLPPATRQALDTLQVCTCASALNFATLLSEGRLLGMVLDTAGYGVCMGGGRGVVM